MKETIFKKIVLLFFAIVIIPCIYLIVTYIGLPQLHIKKDCSESRKFVQSMGSGINIGNALDSCNWDYMFVTDTAPQSYETSWGNVQVTDDLIQMISDKGFKTVRVPVTYMNHIDEMGNVDEEWLKRVAEVVDMVIAKDMYCIIDIHHDTGNDGWIKASEDNYELNHERVTNMILQIAEYFKDYDEHLILESFNEMVDDETKWTKVPYTSLKVFNKWNQLFVDTVRSTGGNNTDRYILVNTYAATCNGRNIYFFEIPDDTVSDRILAGVHGYTSYDNMNECFEAIQKLYDRGYAVVIGEFGSTGNADYDRVSYTRDFKKYADNIGACPILWDDGTGGKSLDTGDITNFAIMNRVELSWYFPEIAQAIIE